MQDKIEKNSKRTIAVGVIATAVIGGAVTVERPTAGSAGWQIILGAVLLITSTIVVGCCGLMSARVISEIRNLRHEANVLREALAAREREGLRRQSELTGTLENIAQQLSEVAATVAAIEKRQLEQYADGYVDGVSGREPALLKRSGLHVVHGSDTDRVR